MKTTHPANNDAMAFIESLLTPEELAESERRVALMSKAIEERLAREENEKIERHA